MKIARHFTPPSGSAFDLFSYEKRHCVIRNPDGSVVFEMRDVEVPRAWSQLAGDILTSKYLRRAGLPDAPHHEVSVRQVVHRIVHTIRIAGEQQGGYFDTGQDAQAFEDELIYVLLDQRGAFNSPVWFNCGLFQEYGIVGAGGNWHWNDTAGDAETIDNNYRHPQCSACFIQSLSDDLMSIFELVKSEARIFKYGSGTGTNFSALRGRQEKLSGGGTSSGLMSFLEVFDRAAGATKSGGTTRRAAKMVCLDADHPEVRDFIKWKSHEERKARALIASGYGADFNGEAYHTVAGQNGNNSVRLPDAFMRAVEEDGPWQTRLRTTGEVCETFSARDMMRDICQSAWECADPGAQFDTTINDWHTCPASGPIRASNPCSEFMFLDDTACNLASINLMKYAREDGGFDVTGFLHTVRLFILAQEILVDFSSYPTREIARRSHLFRPLGLGYANLGTLLMVNGLPYDSEAGRAWAGAITALMTGHAYLVSAQIAAGKTAFEEYPRNAQAMMRVIEKHRRALDAVAAEHCPGDLLEASRSQWEEALAAGKRHGYRNAQVTVLAPTGTIGLLMDCDTTGIEPDYALVKFKKLAGGGYFKIVNQSVRRALARLGYDAGQVRDILEYLVGIQRLEGAPHIHPDALRDKGLHDDEIARIEQSLPGAFDLEGAFSASVLGAEALERLGLAPDMYRAAGFSLLRALGFDDDQIAEAGRVVCGAMTVEGAPHLRPEHYAVFDCANRCGTLGRRFIEPMGHVRMMAAVQPFLSGAISKTVNLPNSATVQDVEDIYLSGWRMGLKAVALYRDGCKSSQPLSTRSGDRGAEGQVAGVGAAQAAGGQGQLELFPELAPPGPRRSHLPKRRRGVTVEARVAGHKVYLRTGEYEDGSLGEIFIDMHKEGSSFRALMMCFAIAVSKGLQYGVPLQEFVDTFTFTNFEPRGICDHPNIKMVNSVIDYVFRVLALEYLGRTEYCQVKPEEIEEAPEEAGDGPPTPLPGPRAVEARAAVPGAGPAPTEARKSPLGGAPASGGAAAGGASPLERQLEGLMGDAPFCDVCGHVTVRNGICYKCLNCGNSMGCS